MMWFAKTQGAAGFIEAFSGDRPFLSVIYVITTPLLGTNPLAWQIFGLVIRVLSGLSAWWMMRVIWPDKYRIACWMGLLMVVFPGFKQQPISVVYGNGIVLLISYFASHALMVLAMGQKKVRPRLLLFAASLLTYAFCLVSTEYYVGLDFFRLVLIWVIVRRSIPRLRDSWKKILTTWLPYLILLAGFLFWRVVIFEFPTYQPVLLETMENGSASQLVNLLFRIIDDPLLASVQAWTSAFHFPDISELSALSDASYWILFVVGTIIAFIVPHFFFNGRLPAAETQEKRFLGEIFLLTGAALLFTGFPYWVTGLPVRLTFPFDRFLLAYMLGSCLLVIALLEWIVKKDFQKNILLAVMVGSTIAANFVNANTYRREWNTFQSMMQQLAWRAPSLRENTLLLTSTSPFTYYSDNSLTAPLNLLYDAENTTLELKYYLAFTDVRLGRSIPSFEADQDVHQRFRSAAFNGNTSQSLAFFYSPPGCLRILDPERDTNLGILPQDYKNFIHLSNLDLISYDQANYLAEYPQWFGAERSDTWCYYFERADLERQFGNWQAAVDLIHQAESQNLSPEEPSEWLVYLEAMFMTQANDEAFNRTERLFFNSPAIDPLICEMLERVISADPALAAQENMQELLETTDCGGGE